jgi:hypothetical protein
MTKRMFTFYTAIIGLLCVYVIIRHLFFSAAVASLRNDIIQGFLIGFGLSFVFAQVYARVKTTRVNGWVTIFGMGLPGNSMLMQAASAQTFPGPVNVPEEAMYWTTSADGQGHTLDGGHNYIMHFPAGGLPPNDAFWSLTMGDAQNRYVANPINRYSISDRTGLVPNTDGSVDIYIQNAAPADHESNWLPAPSGQFVLWLRVYMPGKAILDRKYKVPPVAKVK